jgi:uncharacterized protein YbjT (DUF2867 family)
MKIVVIGGTGLIGSKTVAILRQAGHEVLAASPSVADGALGPPRRGVVEIAGPERAAFDEIVARYLKAVGDPREVVSDPEARYYGARVEEWSLVPLGEARLGRIGLDEWLQRSPAGVSAGSRQLEEKLA